MSGSDGWAVVVTRTRVGQWRFGVVDPEGVEVVGGGGYEDEDQARADGESELAAQVGHPLRSSFDACYLGGPVRGESGREQGVTGASLGSPSSLCSEPPRPAVGGLQERPRGQRGEGRGDRDGINEA